MLNPRATTRIALALLLPALAMGCDSSTEPEPQLVVADMTLEAVGDMAQLEARLDGVVADARWESLRGEIATVTEGGLARATGYGVATVRAHVGSLSADGQVTVLPIVNVQVSELSVVTDPSGQEGMRMRVRNLGGRGYYNLEFWRAAPDGSHERVLSYTTEAEAPVGLDVVHDNYLLEQPADWVVAFSRAPLELDPVRTSCIRLDGQPECPPDPPEQPAAVDSLVVSPGGAVLNIGQTIQYTARTFANGVEVFDRTVEWSTITPTVISLSETGLARALAAGYGQVQATVEGVSFSVGLTVMTPEPEPEPVAYVVIDTHNLPVRLWVGQTWPLQARVLNSQGLPIDGWAVTWGAQDASVATVDSVGMVTGLGHGTTAVSASAGGRTGWVAVKSFARPVDSAELEFGSMLSDTSGLVVQPSVDTTWTDAQNVEHAAFITFHTGHLSLDWSTASPTYEQQFTLRTFIYEDSLQLVEETQYVDTGSLRVLYDYLTGGEIYEMTSAVTPGLIYTGRYSLPGELAVTQPMGTISTRKFYFTLQ